MILCYNITMLQHYYVTMYYYNDSDSDNDSYSDNPKPSQKNMRVYCTYDCWVENNEDCSKHGIGCFPTCVNLKCPQGERVCMNDEKQ
jgi:hypothetical protein